MIDGVQLSRAITERFGLELDTETTQVSDGYKIIISPARIERTISFRVELHLGWRTIRARFIPGNYALGLVRGMRSASLSQKAAFKVFSDSLKSKGAEVIIKLDRQQIEVPEPEKWPDSWTDIMISMKKVGVVVECSKGHDYSTVFSWATAFFGLAIALVPVEKIEEPSLAAETEGTVHQRLVKQYERSRINRAACIEVYGTDCRICGFNFGSLYGELGEGFIHVHHVVPVSEMGGSYHINPAEDLIPVCPNCHAMLHRKKPAILPEKLIQILNQNNIK